MKRLALALILMGSLAACGPSAEVQVQDAWARDTIGRTENAAVFMTITSPGEDRLVAASTPVAGKTDLMTMKDEGGAMAMVYVERIDLPAGEAVGLDPGGLHVWLEELEAPLKAGQTFPLVLEFENGGKQEVEVSVIAPAAAAPMPAMEM